LQIRAAMIELARLWLRHRSGSALSRWFRERVGQARGLVRRLAIVAVARRLLIASWRYAVGGLAPEGAIVHGFGPMVPSHRWNRPFGACAPRGTGDHGPDRRSDRT
jgi:hypothetical protein